MSVPGMRLSHRFTLVFSLVVLALTGALFLAMEGYFRKTLVANAELRAERMAQAVSTVVLPHLLRYDYLTLQQVADGLVDGEEFVYAIILDKEGRVAGYSGRRDAQGLRLGDLDSRRALESPDPMLRLVRWKTPSGTLEVAEAARPVRLPEEATRWGTVRLGLSLATVSQQLAVTRLLLAAFALAGAIAATLASHFLARRITTPLRRLVEATERLEAGNWDPTFRIDTGDEIGELARRFSGAASSLEEETRRLVQAKDELTALNATLEERVAARTDELRASREKYRLLIEGSPDAYCLLDQDRFVFVNAAFLSMFGRSSAEVSEGRLSWTDVVHTNFQTVARARIESLEGLGAVFEEEWVGVSSLGRVIDLEVRGRRVPYEGREIVELVLVDVTQKKSLIQQILQNERMRAMGEMTAMVAHHFNNILAVIHGRAQLVQRRVDEPRLRESLEVIQTSVLKAGEMVRHLQDYFGEQVDLRFVEVEINGLLEEVVYYQERLWRTTRPREAPPIQVRLRLEPLPPVRGAGPLLQDAFGRVLVNAFESMPDGGEIRISTRADESFVEITFEDEGAGMDAETLERAFDPFFTTKGTANRGLGLSASLGILQRHEGRIRLESEPGRGTRVKIILPIEARIARIVPFARSAAS